MLQGGNAQRMSRVHNLMPQQSAACREPCWHKIGLCVVVQVAFDFKVAVQRPRVRADGDVRFRCRRSRGWRTRTR